MTAAVARAVASADHDLLADYVAHCHGLGCSDRALRVRLRAARTLLAAHPNLEEWMRRPVADRLVELRRTEAWPMVAFLIGTGGLRLDPELAVSKNLTGLGVESQHPGEFAQARAAGLKLGWTQAWVDTVLAECLAVIVAWHGGTVHDLSREVIDAFDDELGHSMRVPRSSLKAYRCRLASLRQVLFGLGVHDQPPRRRPWSRTLEQRFGEVPMADQIRVVLLRYVQTRASVLRPKTVESLVNDLLPFAEFLTAHHPDLTTLRALERQHIEGFLVWNRSRPWRGRRARQQPIGAAVAQSTVLTVRNMLEDIAAWGWAAAPSRRLLFAADIPKLDRPLPQALPPDVDARLMDAVDDLEDHFARTGLRLLRGSGLRVGELLDLELDAVLDYGPTGTWLRVPLGKLATERVVPLDQPTLEGLDAWTQHRGTHRPIPHPRTGRPTDFLFTEHGRRLGATRLRNGLAAATTAASLLDSHGKSVDDHPAPAAAHLRDLAGQRRHVAASPDGTARTRHPRDDPALRHSRLADPARGLRRSHGQDAPPPHPHPGRPPHRSRQDLLARRGDALDDVRTLQADAHTRGWTGEAERHATVAAALDGHLGRLQHR
jgi:integrase